MVVKSEALPEIAVTADASTFFDVLASIFAS